MRFDQDLEIGKQLAFLAVDLVDPLEDRLGDADLRAAREFGKTSADHRADPRADHSLRTYPRFELGSDLHQMPAQPVDQADALADQLVAIVSQYLDLVRLLVQERDR